MDHKERLQDKKDAQERYKLKLEHEKEKRVGIFIALWIGIAFLAFAVLCVSSYLGAKKHERNLQATVEQIMIDIENGNFASARVKANSLYWESEWSSNGRTRWNATRKEIIKQIDEAEKKAELKKEDALGDENEGFWSWFGG